MSTSLKSPDGLKEQERAAVSPAAHPVHTYCWRRHAQERTLTLQGQASRCITPHYPYLLLGEQQGIPCTRCCSPSHNRAKGAAQDVQGTCQGFCMTVRGAQESPRSRRVSRHRLDICGHYGPQGGDWADVTDAPRSPEGSRQGNCQDVQKQLRNLLSCDAQSQWDCVCREMHEHDSWDAVNHQVTKSRRPRT